jgi:transcriptional regulator with XRE-family HTH domain
MVTQNVTKSISARLKFQIGNCHSYQVNKNWPQQEIFCTRTRDFAVGKGLVTSRGSLRLDKLAELFKMSAGTLKQDLQNKNRERPGIEKLIFIAEVIGCNRDEFWETAAPAGIEKDRWANASEQDRALATAILDDLMAIPEEQRETYYNLCKEMWKQGIAIGRARIEAEKKQGK